MRNFASLTHLPLISTCRSTCIEVPFAGCSRTERSPQQKYWYVDGRLLSPTCRVDTRLVSAVPLWRLENSDFDEVMPIRMGLLLLFVFRGSMRGAGGLLDWAGTRGGGSMGSDECK